MKYFLFSIININVVLQVNDSGEVVKSIPIDEGNMDYVDYLAWVADGNTAEEWQPESEGI